MTLTHPPAWTVDAACLGQATATHDPWNPPTELEEELWAVARLVCAVCPVRDACLVDALQAGEPNGMRGGLTPTERRRLALQQGHLDPRAARHGTRSRFVRGCTAGPDGGSCRDCRHAHSVYERERRAIRKERRLTPVEPHPWLTGARGRGHRRGLPGQYLLLTLGLPPGRLNLNPRSAA